MSDLNRRDAIKMAGMASFAAALDLTAPQLERAVAGMQALTGPDEPEAGNQQPYTPTFFGQQEWQTVRVLVDLIIPRDARSGSATEAKVPEFMDFLMSDREATEGSKVSMRGGLAWMNNESRRRFGRSFVDASDAQRRAILDDIAWPAKAPPGMSQGVAFFNRFRDLTASGFFSSAMGWKDVQYIGNVFHHWDGCPPAALDKLGVSYDVMNSRVSPGQ